MTEQWTRSYRLSLGEPDPLGLGVGITIEPMGGQLLDISFAVERDETPTPNSAEISIWNLSPTHRDWLSAQEYTPVTLEAGYEGSLGVIFQGFCRSAGSVWDGVDCVTTLRAGDGETSSDGTPIGGGKLQQTWAKGTPLGKVVFDFCTKMGVKYGNLTVKQAAAAAWNGPVLTHSLAVDGPVLDEWIALMRSLGIVWSVQSGAMQLRLGPEPAGVAPIISPFTGLVGRVTKARKRVERHNLLTKKIEVQTVDTVAGRCLLLPGLQPGYQFALQSGAATGLYLCTQCTHSGDTHSDAWYTAFVGAS